MLLALLVLALVTAALAAPAVARALSRRRRVGAGHRRARCSDAIDYDPGRERRAEQRARQLLRSCINDAEWAMYRDLGFIRVDGRRPAGRRAGDEAPRESTGGARAADATRASGGDDAPGASRRSAREAPYAYLVYPHKPILAYVPGTGQLLSEYCVEFPDLTGAGPGRLPASDDVLAKWMALTSDESRVIGRANMHLVGRQLDPSRVRRDLWRLSEWERRHDKGGSVEARRA